MHDFSLACCLACLFVCSVVVFCRGSRVTWISTWILQRHSGGSGSPRQVAGLDVNRSGKWDFFKAGHTQASSSLRVQGLGFRDLSRL